MIKKVETINDLKMLYDTWAMTWEGLREEDFDLALQECCKDGAEGEGYVMSGKQMNDFCKLKGTNAYPDDLTIFAIPNFVGLAMNFGARWMADIIDNNARRENWHPFKTRAESNKL